MRAIQCARSSTERDFMLLITGAAGFIGGNFVHHWFAQGDEPVIVLDKLTYAGNPETIAEHLQAGRATLVRADIGDRETGRQLLATHPPPPILHLAPQNHADPAISGPREFVQTNVGGTLPLLEGTRAYWSA